jgi:CheY-like chemotaxis protein
MTSILLVEDDAELRLLLEHVLLGAGYQVDSAAGAVAACSLLDSSRYDLVLADARLGDGTGLAVAEQAAEMGARILIITGYAFELPIERLGRFDFLLKPVRPAELLEAVARVLQRASS